MTYSCILILFECDLPEFVLFFSARFLFYSAPFALCSRIFGHLLQYWKIVQYKPRSQILNPWLGNIVHSDIGLTYRPASYGAWRAGTTESTITPPPSCTKNFATDLKSTGSWDGIFKLLWSPAIDSATASLCSLAGRYDNPLPTEFLAPIDCSKIPALELYFTSSKLYPRIPISGVPFFHLSQINKHIRNHF